MKLILTILISSLLFGCTFIKVSDSTCQIHAERIVTTNVPVTASDNTIPVR